MERNRGDYEASVGNRTFISRDRKIDPWLRRRIKRSATDKLLNNYLASDDISGTGRLYIGRIRQPENWNRFDRRPCQ